MHEVQKAIHEHMERAPLLQDMLRHESRAVSGQGTRPDSPWNEWRINGLIAGWGAGLSVSEIAKVVGLTRNAVIGKAHRMGLAGRPSPIKRKPRDNAPDHLRPVQRVCEWPSGHPGDPDYSECGKPLWKHTAYCEEHYARSRQRVRLPKADGFIPYRSVKK